MINSQEDLAKFGYRTDMKVEWKVEKFQTRGLFWRLVFLDMAISKSNSFSCDHCEPFLFHEKKLLCMLNWFFCLFSGCQNYHKQNTNNKNSGLFCPIG
jgi:hypothetical protein